MVKGLGYQVKGLGFREVFRSSHIKTQEVMGSSGL